MLAPTRDIALPLLAFLATFALIGCGSGGTLSKSARNAAKTTAGRGGLAPLGPEHPIDMFPVVGASDVNQQASVVRVGSTPITAATYTHWDEVLTPKIASYEPKSRMDCSSVRAPGEVRLPKRKAAKLSPTEIQALCVRQKQAQVKESVLQQLISYQWVIGEAAELGMGVSEAEAQARLVKFETQQFKSKAEFRHYIASSGRTVADALLAIRLEMATERIQELIKRKTERKIDEAAIARYYNQHEKSFSSPETRDIRAIRTWTHDAIATAIAEIRSGKSIASVAKRISIDRPSNEHGGLTAGIVKGQEEAGFDQAIFAAKPHVLTGPLHLRRRYYIFEVVKITPERKTPFKDIENTVRTKLSEELLAREKARFVTAFRRKWLARTSCSPGYVISRCKEWRGPSVVTGEDVYEVK